MRTALITGASSGIGAALARRLAPTWNLILVARRRDRQEAVAAECAHARIVVADLSADDGPEALARHLELPRGLDALVNNAGIFATADTAAYTASHLSSILHLNAVVPMRLTAALLPRLVRGGTIVNVSSVAAVADFSGCGAYAASKAALEAWSRSLRVEVRPQGLRVGVVAPGATDTEVWPSGAPVPRERMCQADDVAQAIAWMLDAPATASIERLAIMPPAGPF